tara:strand:+ start:1030 stop:1263 length:234 start_codon:yes stop_codon:yes gene_type:complete
MAKSRKTFNVKETVDWANKQLARTDEYSMKDGFKAGICHMITSILFESNNYNGFMFIDNNNSKTGTVGYYSRIYFIK